MSALEAGEQVLLIDRKQRKYLIRLAEGSEFHTHSGIVPHDEVIGRQEGTELRTTAGSVFQIWRPTLSDYILKMRRGAQVIYPKDIGAILMYADIAPGVKVLETGIGSGALSLALLRFGAEITGYEISEEFADRAKQNVAGFLGEEALSRYRIEIRDAYEGIDGSDYDRVLLDLPEPWQAAPHARDALIPGGIILAYTPSILQASKFREACQENQFLAAETIEILHRSWHIEGQAVRPDHRMVAHTGFLTKARRG